MTISFDPTVLTSWYSNREGVGGTNTSGASSSSTTPKPTPPWGAQSTAAKGSDLAKALLNGGKVINLSAAKLSVPGATPTANADYKNLFATYQGITALEQLAEQAAAPNIGASELANLQKAFTSGLNELTSYLGSDPFKEYKVAEGTVSASETSTVVRPTESDTYQTGTIFTGSLNDPVPAFSGAVAFSVTVTQPANKSTTVNFDLSELGSTVRSIPNVINYLNGKLKAAGLTTRFSDVRTPGVAQTVTSGGKTYTTAAPKDSFALKLTGNTAESLSFSAPVSNPAVYVLQTSGTTAATTQLTAKGIAKVPADAVQQLVKLNASAAAGTGAADQVYSKTLAAQTTAARATVTGPDGAVYVVSDVSGHAADGETIKGTQDTVLTKYDSAGNVAFTRTLGAANSASGYSLAVSPDGKTIALASSVTGKLDANDASLAPNQTDTTLSTFNTTSGDENWTTRAGTQAGADNPTGVAFAADGSVYVTGVTAARFNGQTQTGTQDAFVQSFSATGVARSAEQFGAAGVNSANGIAVSGNQVFVASTENGHAILRRYDKGSTGALTLGLTRDLGALQGGNVAGVTINADGSVIVAGSTHNGALAAGTATTAYVGGRAAFVARLGPDGAPAASDQISYYDPGGDATASTVTTANGKVYIAGAVTGPATANSRGLPTHQGYVAAIDPTSGAVSWSNKLNGIDGQDVPNSIAVGATGSSVLDAFGLPEGAINYTPPTKLVDISSLRAGDTLGVQVGTGAVTKVTIAADDTIDTLAAKIQLASGYNLTVKSSYTANGYGISIKPATTRSQVTLVAGPVGQDAVAALGLTAGLVSNDANNFSTISKTSNIKIKPYALKLSAQLNLGDSTSIKHAQAQLLAAQSVLKSIYTDMTTKPAPPAKGPGSTGGTVPKYLQSQIANYQSGLARLTGG